MPSQKDFFADFLERPEETSTFFHKTKLDFKKKKAKKQLSFFPFSSSDRFFLPSFSLKMNLPAPASSWEAVAAALFAKDCGGGDESDGTRSETPLSDSDVDGSSFSSAASMAMVTTRAASNPTSSVLAFAAANGRQVREWTREPLQIGNDAAEVREDHRRDAERASVSFSPPL